MAAEDLWDWVKPGIKAESVDVEEVWNQCTILKRIPGTQKVKVRYDGWDASFDEEIPLVPSKLARLGTHTLKRRCWVKVKSTLPAIAFLRSGATKKGVEYLESESKLLFNVQSNNKSEYMFLEPRKCLSWNAYRAENAFKQASQRNAVEEADELPLLFRKGTLPMDDCLQLGRARIIVRSESWNSSPDGTPLKKPSSDVASNKKMRSSQNDSNHHHESNHDFTLENTTGIESSSAPFELTPSQRLARLAKSIEHSVIPTPAAASMSQRSISSTAPTMSENDPGAHDGPDHAGGDIWGRGSSVSSDEFTMRGWTSKKFQQI